MARRTCATLSVWLVTAAAGGLSALGATVIRVAPTGDDANDGLSWATAKRTVQGGLNAAVSGDEVWVAAGTYVERITLKAGVALYGGFAGSEAGLAERNWAANVTVLDGNQGGSVVTSPWGATASTRIDGFTIRNGIGAVSGSYRFGGGIYSVGGSPTIANNTITGNTASYGGGIYCSQSSAMIANNTITANTASGGGGGIYCSSSSPTIANTIVAFNSSGIYKTGSYVPAMRSNCVFGNTAYNYSGLTDPTGTNGNIRVDPGFAGAAYRNLHLRPDSPCRDAGDDSVVQAGWLDMDGQARIQGGRVDIGADESDGTVWPTGPNVIVRVSPDGNDANDGSSWALAKRTVQAGIDAASAAGGDVWVKAGTYPERITLLPYAYVYGGFAGTESSRDQRDWVANVTVLDGQSGGSVVTADRGGPFSTIDGFTIRNGTGTDGRRVKYGGGIYCYNSSPTIAHNTITGNSATGVFVSGGGIYCYNSSPTIANNTITGNSATGSYASGGGIYCSGGFPTIANNTITGNSATSSSGSASGGGIYCSSSSPTIANTIVAFNSSGIYNTGSGTPMLRSNCVFGNTAYNYSGLTDPTGTNGNIRVDPLFIRNTSPGPDGQWGTADDDYGDLRLRSGSPCIDAGRNADVPADTADVDGDGNTTEPLPFDLGGGPRVMYQRVDMGAYEYRYRGPADADRDADVDIVDFLFFRACFAGPNGPAPAVAICEQADHDGDGDVDLDDFLVFSRCFNGPNRPPGCAG